jgi:hypothetical protein
MPRQQQNLRWIDNPERRIGRTQMLRAMLASMKEHDPLYDAYVRQIEAPRPAAVTRNTHD